MLAGEKAADPPHNGAGGSGIKWAIIEGAQLRRATLPWTSATEYYRHREQQYEAFARPTTIYYPSNFVPNSARSCRFLYTLRSHAEIEKRYEAIQENIAVLEQEKTDRQFRAGEAEAFLNTVKDMESLSRDELFIALVDRVVVGKELKFVLKDGSERVAAD